MNDDIYQEAKENLVDNSIKDIPSKGDVDSQQSVTPYSSEYNFKKWKGEYEFYPDFTIPIDFMGDFNTTEIIFQILKWSELPYIMDGSVPILIYVNIQDPSGDLFDNSFAAKLGDLSNWINSKVEQAAKSGVDFPNIVILIRGVWFPELLYLLDVKCSITISSNCVHPGNYCGYSTQDLPPIEQVRKYIDDKQISRENIKTV